MVGMPTVVAKGTIFASFDKYLETSEHQYAMLKALKEAVAAGLDTVVKLSSGMFGNDLFPTAEDIDHTQADWFGVGHGPRSSFFRTLSLPVDPLNPDVMNVNGHATVGAPTDKVVQSAKVLMAHGMIEALETALGIDDGTDPFATGATLPPSRPVEILWVCGKGDGFECQVVWNSRQVTLLLVTPPVKFLVEDLIVTTLDRRAAKRDRTSKGMVIVRPTAPLDSTPIKRLMAQRDGGVTPDP